MSPTIFVNYRISVSIKDANNLRTKLEAVLGEGTVFMDKYEIKTGEEWAEKIRTALEAAKVVLVLISPGWLECPYKETKPHKGKYWKKGARRLDDPEDWVRREIEIALADPAKSVHPLLFSGAELPDEADYPEDSNLSPLNERQARRITDDRLDRDLEDFIREACLREKIGLPTATATVPAWQDPHADLPDILPAESAPFIGLRHFDEANARLFFGRGSEIQTLTQLIHSQREVRLTLLYGATGVGKSSLLHAGLLPRLRLHDWQPVYLRRSEVKAEGFHNAFARILAENAAQTQAVFILDQVEEMFADPVPDEVASFFDCLREALRSRPTAQFILGFRNDFLDSVLKPLSERGLQETYDFRTHRVEPLGEQGIKEAILGVTQNPKLIEHYDFEFDPELPELLLRDVLADNNPRAHKAPLLQIQLRKLWDSTRELYPKGHMTIRKERYLKSETLDEMLQQQLDQLETAWPEQVRSGLALDVLQGFTTPLSTATARSNDAVLKDYAHVLDFPTFFEALKNTYLLLEQGRFDTRLAHDSLAPLVRRRFTTSNKPGQRAMRILESKKEDIIDYQTKRELFTEDDLDLLEKGKIGMRIHNEQEEQAISHCSKQIKDRQSADILRRERYVEIMLREADRHILHLEYNNAIKIIADIIPEGVKSKEICHLLLEIAFFRTEIGEHLSAWIALESINLLDGRFKIKSYEEIKQVKSAMPKYVREIANNFDFLSTLEERYYPKMIFVEGGEFSMGDEEFENARPVHRVMLSSFHIAETPITNWQYGLYCAAMNKNIFETQHGWSMEGNNPVINISWYDAVAYANWLSQQKRLSPVYKVKTHFPDPNALDKQKIDWLKKTDFRSGGYRLPTKAEWEYAAKGGHKMVKDSNKITKYAGSDDVDKVAWYNKNSKYRTQAVKKLAANELEIYDMSGNVFEWCADFYDSQFYEQFQSKCAENPWGPEQGKDREACGGSWKYNQAYCRIAFRDFKEPISRLTDQGFRLVRYWPFVRFTLFSPALLG